MIRFFSDLCGRLRELILTKSLESFFLVFLIRFQDVRRKKSRNLTIDLLCARINNQNTVESPKSQLRDDEKVGWKRQKKKKRKAAEKIGEI